MPRTLERQFAEFSAIDKSILFSLI